MSEVFPRARERVGVVDWLMLALAVLSVGLLLYAMFAQMPAERRHAIFLIDTAICGIFAVEFVWRWTRDARPRTFPLRRWYEIVGMIPVSHPALRSFRLLRLLRIAVLLSRFGRAANRALGDEFTYHATRRFRGAIADAISDTIAVRMFDQLEEIIDQGTFARNLAAALEDHRHDIHGIIHDRIRQDPTVRRMRYLPFFNELVETITVVTQRVVIELLRDPRTGRLARAVVQENVRQLRATVRQRDEERDAAAARGR